MLDRKAHQRKDGENGKHYMHSRTTKQQYSDKLTFRLIDSVNRAQTCLFGLFPSKLHESSYRFIFAYIFHHFRSDHFMRQPIKLQIRGLTGKLRCTADSLAAANGNISLFLLYHTNGHSTGLEGYNN